MENIWIIKNIFKINFLVYISILLAVLTATFQEFFIISFLIIIHELGHVTFAIIQKIKVEKIILYPLGGITKLKMPLNISSIKEAMILLGGPLFQFLAYILLLLLLPSKIDTIKLYHQNILLFNLLPIYPLDGGKLLKIILDLFLPYKVSFKFSIFISYILEIVIFLFTPIKKINTFITFFFLLFLTYQESKKENIIYEKFLLERYLNEYNFSKSKFIKNSNYFYRNKKHLIKQNEKYYLEKEFLSKKYHKISENY